MRWRPFLLGPIFVAQGWPTSPFNIYPARGRYMVRDLERIAARRGIPFRLPDPFPQSSLLASRVALALEPPARAAFCRQVFETEFAGGALADISSYDLMARCLELASLPSDHVLAAAGTDEVKLRLRQATDEAIALGIFGAPSFVTTDGELFWGDDRLEQALDDQP